MNYYQLKINCLNKEHEIEKTFCFYASCEQMIENKEGEDIISAVYLYTDDIIPISDSYTVNIEPIPKDIKRKIIIGAVFTKFTELNINNKHIILYQ